MDNNSTIDTLPKPVAEDTLPAQPPAIPPSPNKRSPRLLIGGMLAAALILVGGGGALAYTMYYQNPEKVVHDALINVIQAKTMSLAGTIAYKDKGVSVDLALDANTGQTDSEFAVEATVTVDSEGTKQKYSASGTGRVIENTLYFKLDGVKEIAETAVEASQGSLPPYSAAIIEKIDGRWIRIDSSDYDDLYQDMAKQQECLTSLSEKIRTDRALTNEVTELYSKNKFIVIKEELGSKTVNGVSSLGYKIDVDQEATENFVRGLEETKLGKELQTCNDDTNFGEIADSLTGESAQSERTPTVELWVSRFGHELTEFAMYGDTSDTGNLNIVMQPTFNKNVTVEAPEDAASFETVMEEIRTVLMEYYSSEMDPAAGTMPAGTETDMDMDYLLAA